MAVVNAATTAKDMAWFQRQAVGFDVALENASERLAMLAVQGPRAGALVAGLLPAAAIIPRFHAAELPWAGETAIVMHTGYTGEDGFEVAASSPAIRELWAALLARGAACGLQPCGLGARDTLRLEAGYLLYGQDADETRTPDEANCGWVVKMAKGDFMGREGLRQRTAAGLREKLMKIKLLDRGVPRHGCAVWHADQQIGTLTSATFAPSLGMGIGLGYLPVALGEPGRRVEIEIHGKRVAAEVVAAFRPG